MCSSDLTGLIPCSQKLREILTLLCCITLSSSRGNQRSAQEVARRISGAIAGEVFAEVKTYQVPITNSSPSHYIICHLPLVVLSPTSTLPFDSPSLSQSPLSFACLFVCLCVGFLVAMASPPILVITPEHEILNLSKGGRKSERCLA